MTAHAILSIYRQARAQGVEPREARIVECVNAFAGIADPATYLVELRSIAALLDVETRP